MDALRAVAAEVGQSAARVAMSWVVNRPGVTSTLVGVSRVEQLPDNLAALDLRLSPEHLDRLDAASAPAEPSLYALFTPPTRNHVTFGGVAVQGWAA